MGLKPHQLTLEQQVQPNLPERTRGVVYDLCTKLGRTAAVGVLVVGAISTAEAYDVLPARADGVTTTYGDLGYDNADMPCEHSPYATSGVAKYCANYDWGLKHTEAYDDPSELSSRGFAYRTCTDWVAFREDQVSGFKIPSGTFKNGGQWYSEASSGQKSLTPKAWDAGVVPSTTSNPDGHVVFVESVNSVDANNPLNDNVTITEYNHDTAGGGDTRTGKASDMGITEYVDFGLHPANGSTASTGPASYADGTFLKVNESQAIYRMVGGAPVRIYNQGAIPDFNGSVTSISNAALGSMPNYPADGEFISIAEAGGSGVYEFVGGAPIREYNWSALPNFHGAVSVNAQSLGALDHMRATPKDGAVVNIQEAGGSGIYEFVGGAPVRQYNWGAIPNFGTAININAQSLSTLDHMNAVPADGSVVSIAEAGGAGIYRFVGGAPIRLYNWGAIPDMPNVVVMNQQSLAVLDHMNARPSDGSVINLVEAGGSGIYEFVGGAPMRLFNWGIIPGLHNSVSVNSESVADLDHMNATPANGEFIASTETGVVYRVAGGAALPVYNQGGLPGYNGAVLVNQQTLDTHDHMNTVPADGTVIEGVTTQTYWKIIGGKRTQVSAQSGAVIVDEQTVAGIPAS